MYHEILIEKRSAGSLLRIISLCGKAPIPRGLLQSYEELASIGDVDEDAHTLARYSLLVRNARTGQYLTSRLVQVAIKSASGISLGGNQLETWIGAYVKAMHRTCATTKLMSWDLWRDLYPHAEYCWNTDGRQMMLSWSGQMCFMERRGMLDRQATTKPRIQCSTSLSKPKDILLDRTTQVR
jgi:hypothetical protein